MSDIPIEHFEVEQLAEGLNDEIIPQDPLNGNDIDAGAVEENVPPVNDLQEFKLLFLDEISEAENLLNILQSNLTDDDFLRASCQIRRIFFFANDHRCFLQNAEIKDLLRRTIHLGKEVALIGIAVASAIEIIDVAVNMAGEIIEFSADVFNDEEINNDINYPAANYDSEPEH